MIPKKTSRLLSLLLGTTLLLIVTYRTLASAPENSGRDSRPQPAAALWTSLPVSDDPLVRMPGTQPDEGVKLDGPGQCASCHADYDPLTAPADNWQGSMMAHSARDFLFWATMTVAGQDAIWPICQTIQ